MEIDPGIDDDVTEIRNDVAEQAQHRSQGKNSHKNWVIAPDDRFQTQASHSGNFEDLLDNDGTGEHDAQNAADPGGNGNQGVAQSVTPNSPPG